MKRLLIIGIGLMVAALPATADAKGKGNGNGNGNGNSKGVPPGQVRKAEVQDALARGESPSRRYKTVPSNVYRNWERDRVYTWEDQRYRWNDGSWVIYVD